MGRRRQDRDVVCFRPAGYLLDRLCSGTLGIPASGARRRDRNWFENGGTRRTGSDDGIVEPQGVPCPMLENDGWSTMISNDYLMINPSNPLAGSSVIDVDTIDTGGWLWRDKGNGTYCLYAVDAAGDEFVE